VSARGERLLVVGGGQGIGKAIAAAWPERTTSWTRGNGVDATDPQAVRGAFATFQQQHGAPAALLHCVGDFAEQPLLATDAATWRHLFASNVDSVFHVVQAVVPAMVAAKRGRVILFAVAGVDKDRGMLRAPAYFAAKAAVVQLGRSLALETAAAGVTVNVIAPGLIHHPHSHQESQARIVKRVPLGRLGSTDDVLGMVRYLLSPATDYVTGQVLTVDGGLHA
jgi:NAD(P)-dependent dehydrogenase (short-subunit alcohol dehydrogenase family)